MRLINRNVGLTQQPILNPHCLLYTEDEDRWGISAMGEMTVWGLLQWAVSVRGPLRESRL